MNAYLATRRFDANGNEIGAARGAQTLLAEDLTPSVAAASANDSLIAVQEGDIDHGMRAVVYRERDLLPLPPPPQPPQNVHVVPGQYSSATVTWDPPPGPQPELYVVELYYDGEWDIVARVSPRARSVSTSEAYGPLRVRAFGPGGGSEPVEAGALPRRRSVRR